MDGKREGWYGWMVWIEEADFSLRAEILMLFVCMYTHTAQTYRHTDQIDHLLIR